LNHGRIVDGKESGWALSERNQLNCARQHSSLLPAALKKDHDQDAKSHQETLQEAETSSYL
jgi:hypothetical protein